MRTTLSEAFNPKKLSVEAGSHHISQTYLNENCVVLNDLF